METSTCRLHRNIRWTDIAPWSADGGNCWNERAGPKKQAQVDQRAR